MISDALSLTNYEIRKQMLKLFGGKFRIYDPAGTLCFYAEMKAFKLKEELSIYTGEDKATPVFNIKARSILDFSAAYDITEPLTGEKIGVLKRKGFHSMIRDEWVIMDGLDQEIGTIQEDSMLMALLRRFLTNLIPQGFHGTVRGMPVLAFKQNFNPFTLRMNLDFSADTANQLDRRIGLAAAVLFCAIEGRQKD